MRHYYFPDYNGYTGLSTLSDGMVTETGTSRPRTIASHAADGVISLASFSGVDADGTDVRAAFQFALETAATLKKGLLVPQSSTGYTIGGTGLVVPNGTRLVGEGINSLIKAHASLVGPLLITAAEADDIWLEGLYLDCDGIATHGFDAEGTNSNRLRVYGCTVVSPTIDAIKIKQVIDCHVDDNHIVTPAQHGITFTTTAENWTARGNRIVNPGGAGIIFSVGIQGVISGNRVDTPGGNGDGVTGYHEDNRDVVITDNIIDSSQNHGMHVGGLRLIVSGNIINGAAAQGIFLRSYDGINAANTRDSFECVVEGNTIQGAYSGLWIEKTYRSIIANNVVRDSNSTSALFRTSNGNVISGNALFGTTLSNGGILLEGSQKNLISDNITTGHVTTDGYRFVVDSASGENSTENTISNNLSESDSRGFIETAGANDNLFTDNRVLNHVSTPGTFSRVGSGSKWHASLDDVITVASAASPTLAYHGNIFKITGTTTITSISGAYGWTGREIVLLFDDACTLGNAGTIKLNGGVGFVAASGYIMRLIFDGTNWVEAGRGTGVELMPQQPLTPEETLSLPTQEEVFAFLRSDISREYRIDVESNSTIRADLSRAQEQMTGFMQAAGAFVQAFGPPVQEGFMPAEMAVTLFSAFAAQFKLGKQAEDALAKFGEQAREADKKPKKPSPEEIKARGEMQKMAADQQAKQAQAAADMQAKSQEHQMKLAELQAKLQGQAAELQMKERELQLKEREIRITTAAKMQQAQMDAAVKERQAQTSMVTTEHKARVGMQMQNEKARQQREKPKGYAG